MKFALLQLRNRAHAEDAVQETLLAALEGAKRFAGGSSLSTWLIGILKHKIVDHIRREAREPSLEAASTDEAALEPDFREDGHFRNPPAHWDDPEAALGRREFREALQASLERLPPRIARAFTLREVMGLSIQEVCDVLGISEANCAVMLYRARTALRQRLEQHWFTAEARRREPRPLARGSA
jgi:RNA polymerase sigma-70 factor (ECF subfamily)